VTFIVAGLAKVKRPAKGLGVEVSDETKAKPDIPVTKGTLTASTSTTAVTKWPTWYASVYPSMR